MIQPQYGWHFRVTRPHMCGQVHRSVTHVWHGYITCVKCNYVSPCVHACSVFSLHLHQVISQGVFICPASVQNRKHNPGNMFKESVTNQQHEAYPHLLEILPWTPTLQLFQKEWVKGLRIQHTIHSNTKLTAQRRFTNLERQAGMWRSSVSGLRKDSFFGVFWYLCRSDF